MKRMTNAMKRTNYAIKLSNIIYCQNLSDWDQFMDYLQELDNSKLADYAFNHAYLVTQFLNENRRNDNRK